MASYVPRVHECIKTIQLIRDYFLKSMSNGRFKNYYWDIRTLLSETDVVADYSFTSPDQAELAAIFDFRIFLNNGFQLIAMAALDSNTELWEHSYYYCLRTDDDVRIVAYDDSNHHRELNTSPDHMHKGPELQDEPDRAFPSDLNEISFRNVFSHVISSFVF